MTFLFYTTLLLFILLCGLLCLVILLQESKSMGLGASFGGDAGDSFFGTSTADVLKKFTGWLTAMFMVICVVLSLWCAGIGRSKITQLPLTIEETSDQVHTSREFSNKSGG
jgi:preprotein translocase subunit SecG